MLELGAGFFSRLQVELLVGDPTRITELSVPKSSELFTASGSATQREPLIIKAYSWRPGERGTETDQTPGAPESRSLFAPFVHSLKSPMISTLRARGSTKTNRTRFTVSGPAGTPATAGAGVVTVRVQIRDPIASVESAANAEIPAASASAPSGESWSLALRHQTVHPRGTDAGTDSASAPTRSISLASKEGSRLSGVRRLSATRSISAAVSSEMSSR